MSKKGLYASSVCMLLAAAVATPSSAAEVKAAGSATYITVSSESTPHGEMTLEREHSKTVILADDPNAPIHLSTQDCSGTNLIGADGVPIVASGYCDGADKDGDIWWIWFHNSAAGNKWGFLGGTGKFEGVTGGGTTEQQVFMPDGRLVIRWEGTWEMK